MATKQQLVLAFFDNEPAAEQAVSALKQWDKANEEIKLGAIGILVKDSKGEIKTQKVMQRFDRCFLEQFQSYSLLFPLLFRDIGVRA